MTKQFLTLFFAAMACAANSNAQQLEDSKLFKFENKNNVQLEAFGSGVFYSVIFEHIFINQNRFKTNVNLGGAYYGEKANVLATHLVHGSLNQIFSITPNHHLEIGAGIAAYKENLSNVTEAFQEDEYSFLITARVGYRYQKPDGKFLLRVACTPIAEGLDRYAVHPWPALAVGYSF